MNLTQDYLASQFPTTRLIAGVVVKPYCLGHAMLLHRVQSPLVDETGRTPGMGDGLLALWICSRPATEAIAQIHGKRLKWWMRWNSWRLRHWDAGTLTAALRVYILTGSIGPRVHPKHETEEEPGAPLFLTLLLHQMRTLGRSEQEALNAPLRKVKWLFSGHHEGEGNCSIVSEQEVSEKWEHFHKTFPNSQPITRAMFEEIKRRKKETEGKKA